MVIIMQSLESLAKERKLTKEKLTQNKELAKKDIEYFKDIIFNRNFLFAYLGPEYDISVLTDEEIIKFYNFAEQSAILYKKNNHKVNFLENLKLVIEGK